TGLAILAAKPKVGKSFLSMDLCAALVTGTHFLRPDRVCEKAAALYLDLEGGGRLSQKRLASVSRDRVGADGKPLSLEHLYLVNHHPEIPPIQLDREFEDQGFTKWLSQLFEALPVKPLLVIIDTFAAIQGGGERGFQVEYKELGSLRRFAQEKD